MKHTVPTLTAFALMGALPAFGASIADDLTIKPKAQIQVRAQLGASGTNTAGQDVNIFNGAQGDTEAARFSVRRARFGAEAKNTTGWSAVFQIRAGERADAGARSTYITSVTTTGTPAVTTTTTGDLSTNKTRTAELYYANVTKLFKPTEGFDIDVHMGLDKPFNGESSISSSGYLFPMDRPNAHFTEYRDTGVGTKALIAEMVRVGFDVQNGSTTLSPDTNSDAAGLFTSARIEFSPGKDLMAAKKLESWAGAEGQHLVIGFDYLNDSNRLSVVSAANDQTVSVVTIGPDILFHFNGLTALADLRMRTTKTENSTGASVDDIKGQVWTIQAGYAIPMEQGFAIEPALRFSKIDLNKDVDQEGGAPFNQGEYRAGASGTEFTLGVNAYWNSHANKTQLAYTKWTGEEGATAATGDKAKAHVITLQHQVTF